MKYIQKNNDFYMWNYYVNSLLTQQLHGKLDDKLVSNFRHPLYDNLRSILFRKCERKLRQ